MKLKLPTVCGQVLCASPEPSLSYSSGHPAPLCKICPGSALLFLFHWSTSWQRLQWSAVVGHYWSCQKMSYICINCKALHVQWEPLGWLRQVGSKQGSWWQKKRTWNKAIIVFATYRNPNMFCFAVRQDKSFHTHITSPAQTIYPCKNYDVCLLSEGTIKEMHTKAIWHVS